MSWRASKNQASLPCMSAGASAAPILWACCSGVSQLAMNIASGAPVNALKGRVWRVVPVSWIFMVDFKGHASSVEFEVGERNGLAAEQRG
ncbi:MAG: hypothetical protein QOD67_1951 [Caballeronia sp.]|nr:hypothetical protein [Caballeronia sp.]